MRDNELPFRRLIFLSSKCVMCCTIQALLTIYFSKRLVIIARRRYNICNHFVIFLRGRSNVGKEKGNIANPDLHSSESPAKDGNELKNRINETAKYSELFEKIDVDSDYDDILATYEKTLDKRTRAAMKKRAVSLTKKSPLTKT